MTTHEIAADYGRLTHIWENLKRASMLMLRSNTFMVEAGKETLTSKSLVKSRDHNRYDHLLISNIVQSSGCYTWFIF